MEIKIERQPSQEHLNQLGVNTWGIWEKEVSTFPWNYPLYRKSRLSAHFLSTI